MKFMETHVHDLPKLTKNQALVLDVLSAAEGPLSAYMILDQLREQGFRAPLQVYRALEKLMAFGIVHRLESLNAFVACSRPGCDNHDMIAFAICDDCGQVDEVSDEALAKRLKTIAKAAEFGLQRSTVELHGLCRNCQPQVS